MTVFEHEVAGRGALRRLGPVIQPHLIWLCLTVLNAVEDVGMRVITPYLLQEATDAAVREGLPGFVRWMGLAAILMVSDAGFTLLGRRSVARYTAYTIRDLRDRVTAHVQRLPMSYADEHHTGDLVSRLTTDVGKVESWLPTVAALVYEPLVFLAGFVYMLTVSWKLLLASCILIPGSAALYNRLNRPIADASRRQSEEEGRAAAALQDMLAGVATVKAFNLQSFLTGNYATLIREIERQGLRLDWRRAVSIAVFLALRYTPQLIVPLYGGYLAYLGEITVGQLLAANLVIWMVFLPIERLLNILGQTREAIPALARVWEVLDHAPEEGSDRRPYRRIESAPPLAFRDVSFAYEPGKEVLRDVSFEVRQGEKVALVGASGCGKSTLLKLLVCFYPPQAGSILIYGNDIAAANPDGIREQMALMEQDTYLFPMTIAENIGYGKPGATDAEIVAAAQAANAHGFITALPEGYETQVGERGSHLSGGERQRIALARAILKDAPILLLDEPTSALDTHSEFLVQEALTRFMAGRTTLVIAHRLSTIQQMDRVLVLGAADGTGAATLCEQGTHADLMASDTRYRRLYLKQVQDVVENGGGGL